MKFWSGIVLFTALSMFSCGGNGNQADKGNDRHLPAVRVPVQAVPVQTGTLKKTLTIYGNLQPQQVTTLSSQFPGRLVQLSLAEGDRVTAGQVVARIRSPKAEALQQTADATSASILKKEMQPLTLRAPYSGVVIRKFRYAGDVVAAGEPILEILDDSRFFLWGALPAAYLPEVKIGQALQVSFPDLPGKTFRATIEKINSTVDPKTQMARIRASLVNRHSLLKAHLFARIRITVQSEPAALLIPRQAVLGGPAGTFVFVVKNGIAHRQAVETGLADSARVSIRAGLSPGDSVVISGNFELKDGMAVEVNR